jgi:hypothetical protein
VLFQVTEHQLRDWDERLSGRTPGLAQPPEGVYRGDGGQPNSAASVDADVRSHSGPGATRGYPYSRPGLNTRTGPGAGMRRDFDGNWE